MSELSSENKNESNVIQIDTKLNRLCNDIKDEVNDFFKNESLYIKFEIRNDIAYVQVFDNDGYVYDCYSTPNIGKLEEDKGKDYIVSSIKSAISNWVSDGKPVLRNIAKDISGQVNQIRKGKEGEGDNEEQKAA